MNSRDGQKLLRTLTLLTLLPSSLVAAENAATENIDAPMVISEGTMNSDPTIAASTQTTDKNGDTYNFYFQKAPGVQTVEQGTGTQRVAQATSETTEPTPSHGSTWTDRKRTEAVYGLYLGLEKSASMPNLGSFIGGQVFVRGFLAQADLHFSSATTNEDHSVGGGGIRDRTSKRYSQGTSLALGYAPFEFGSADSGGYLGFVAGVSFVTVTDKQEVNDLGFGQGIQDRNEQTNSHKTVPFIGMTGTFGITNSFAVMSSLRVASENQSSLGVAGVYKF